MSLKSPDKTGSGKIFLLSAAAFLSYAAWIFLPGEPLLGGDTVYYDEWADILISTGWDFGSFIFLVEDVGGTEVLFLASIVCVAILKLLLGVYWMFGFIVVNWLALGLTAAIVLAIGGRLNLSGFALVGGAIILTANWEMIYWGRYILTDILFLPFSAGCLYFIGLAAAHRRWLNHYASIGVALILVAIALFIRPSGLWLAAFLCLTLALSLHRQVSDFACESRHQRHAIAACVILAIIAIFATSHLLADPWLRQPRFLLEIIQFIREYNLDGEVVRARPETFVAPPQTASDFAVLFTLKFVYFFAFLAEGFRPAHNAYNVATFIPFYGLAIAGVVAVFRRDRRLETMALRFGLLSLLFVFVFALLHAITIVDYGWRYRLPCYPALTVLAMIGIDCYGVPVCRRLIGALCSTWLNRRFASGTDAESS